MKHVFLTPLSRCLGLLLLAGAGAVNVFADTADHPARMLPVDASIDLAFVVMQAVT